MSDYAHSSPSLNPTRFHLPFEDDTPPVPATPVIVRCARCPNWQAVTTVSRMRQRYESHVLRVHGGK